MQLTRLQQLFTIFALASVPMAVSANVGVPWLTSYIFYSFLFLAPIILIETTILKKQLQTTILKSLGIATAGNIASTLFGIAIFFGSLFVLGMGPPESTSQDIFNLLLLYPFYRISVWIEFGVVSKMIKQVEIDVIRNAVRIANRLSYFMLNS